MTDTHTYMHNHFSHTVNHISKLSRYTSPVPILHQHSHAQIKTINTFKQLKFTTKRTTHLTIKHVYKLTLRLDVHHIALDNTNIHPHTTRFDDLAFSACKHDT